MKTALDEAIQIAGGLRALGRALGIRHQIISHWKDRRVPAERVLELEHITGVSRHDLRPDIYPREKQKRA
jgi:DNA-binding transcriptional regulator YdaS (Cro superfamily)